MAIIILAIFIALCGLFVTSLIGSAVVVKAVAYLDKNQ